MRAISLIAKRSRFSGLLLSSAPAGCIGDGESYDTFAPYLSSIQVNARSQDTRQHVRHIPPYLMTSCPDTCASKSKSF
ncbi:hypothetical protein BD310DRAFT_925223 [Dichomitus squalens]|uniref:Uncharacterized protein n=1 Tax=Dichomitus squalens TaxID=114155 RepID=A0A4Q9PXG8_9APHY|nr:hypothetical protein BD310DRAFT_925223 [Dichomitus squalens]